MNLNHARLPVPPHPQDLRQPFSILQISPFVLPPDDLLTELDNLKLMRLPFPPGGMRRDTGEALECNPS